MVIVYLIIAYIESNIIIIIGVFVHVITIYIDEVIFKRIHTLYRESRIADYLTLLKRFL